MSVKSKEKFKSRDYWQPSKSQLGRVVVALLDADGHARRKTLLDACKKLHMSGQTFANCLKVLENQHVIQVKRSSRKHVELTLNYETERYPLKAMKKWSMNEYSERMKQMRTSSWLETPVDLFQKILPSYEQLFSELRHIKTHEEAMDTIDLYLTLRLTPQLREHAENFWKKTGKK